MDPLELSRREVPQLLWRKTVGSTNSELVALAADPELAAFTTLATDDQTAGRGRLDRAWVAAAGSALAVSVLVRAATSSGHPIDSESFGWLPLAAGAAMFDAVTSVLEADPAGPADPADPAGPHRAARPTARPTTPPAPRPGVKWPNDVQLDDRKVCGILCELVPTSGSQPAPAKDPARDPAKEPAKSPGRRPAPAVVIGAGLNVTMSPEELPVPTATSLAIAGADATDPAALIDRVLAAYLRALTASVTALWEAHGDADRSGLRAAVVERCSTIGREVRVELPGGAQLLGRAVGIDTVGRLEVRDDRGQVRPVAAGDIIHLR